MDKWLELYYIKEMDHQWLGARFYVVNRFTDQLIIGCNDKWRAENQASTMYDFHMARLEEILLG